MCGQAGAVSAEHLVALVRAQNDAFMRVAAHVALAHERVEALREHHRRTHGGADPFGERDRAEVRS